jgi:hypothetical protein
MTLKMVEAPGILLLLGVEVCSRKHGSGGGEVPGARLLERDQGILTSTRIWFELLEAISRWRTVS